MTLLYFTAAWCPTCQELERDVLSTPAGRQATKALRALKVDVDAEGGQALVTRYVILAYPSALVLDATGREVGRVVGFDNATSWLSGLARVSESEHSLARLQGQAKARPNDPRAAIALYRALLERGDKDAGISGLQEVLVRWPEDDASAEALWCLGRYYHRVQGDPATAQHLWRELGQRFPGGKWAVSAWSWFGKAQSELGRVTSGARVLASLSKQSPAAPGLLKVYARYLLKHDLRGHFPNARALIGDALESDRKRLSAKDIDSLRELRARLQ